jgi:hypothetical protein
VDGSGFAERRKRAAARQPIVLTATCAKRCRLDRALPAQAVYFEGMDLRHAIEEIRPAVVQITLTASGLSERAISELGGHGQVFSRPIGTGFFVGSTGAVVTAKHVVDAVPEWEDCCRTQGATFVHTGIGIAHLMPRGKRGGFTVGKFDVVATDDVNDLAVLRPRMNPFAGEFFATLDGDRVPLLCEAAHLNTERPQDGLPVGCSGYPLMSFVLITNAGIVASSWSVDLKQLPGTDPHELPDVYLADMQINGGNSGGPVYSALDSGVIGVAVASRLAPSTGTVPGQKEDAGLTVIVPSRYVGGLLDKHGIKWKQSTLRE